MNTKKHFLLLAILSFFTYMLFCSGSCFDDDDDESDIQGACYGLVTEEHQFYIDDFTREENPGTDEYYFGAMMIHKGICPSKSFSLEGKVNCKGEYCIGGFDWKIKIIWKDLDSGILEGEAEFSALCSAGDCPFSYSISSSKFEQNNRQKTVIILYKANFYPLATPTADWAAFEADFHNINIDVRYHEYY